MSRTQEWLNGYFRAWASKDPDDVRAIFTDDAQYWFRPDDPDPARGIDAIIEMWGEPEPAEPSFAFDVLIENDDLGIAKGHVDYPGHEYYSNLWEIHFADDGRANRFVEWFMTPRKRQGSN